MIKSPMRRAFLLVLVFALLSVTSGSFHKPTQAQGDWDYMCDAWEQSCDDGSGDWWNSGGGGGGGGESAVWICPNSDKCGNFGCHPRSIADPTQVCSRYNFEGVPFNCSSPINCTRR